MKTRLSLALLLALSLVGPALADGMIIPNPPICKGGPCPPPPCLPPPCVDCPVPLPAQPCVDCVVRRPWPCPPFNTPLRVKSHHVTVTIDQQVATTRIDQIFVNDAAYAVEGKIGRASCRER